MANEYISGNNNSIQREIIIVIPCFNEEKRIDEEAFLCFLNRYNPINLLFVNDGSTDNTLKIINSLSAKLPSQIKVLDLEKNEGKGYAVWSGINAAMKDKNCNYIGYLDADLATPLDEAGRLLKILSEKKGIKGILGSRVNMLGRNINRKFMRYFFSRVLSLIIGSIFKIKVYDTQCGAKFFTRDLATEIFKDRFYCKWLFDIEIIIRSRKLYYGSKDGFLYEEPLDQWTDKNDSKLRIKDYFIIFSEILKIFRNYK